MIRITENDFPPTPEEVAEILDAAADYFLIHPWLQKHSVNQDARCMVSSVSQAAWDRARRDGLGHPKVGWSHDALLAVRRHLGKRTVEALPRWNDAPGRTVDEVIEALRITAKKVREGDIVV